VSLCIVLVTWPFQPFGHDFHYKTIEHFRFSCINHLFSMKGKIATTCMLFCLMRQNRQYLFNMSYLEVFGVLTGVGADVSKFFGVGVGAGVLKHGAEAELKSEKCDSAHIWFRLDPDCKTFQNLGSGPDLDLVNAEEMRGFCCEKAAFFNFFVTVVGLGLYIGKTFWTVVGLGLSFKKSGLDLDLKIWQSVHFCDICEFLHIAMSLRQRCTVHGVGFGFLASDPCYLQEDQD